jgi:hypothetical protein
MIRRISAVQLGAAAVAAALACLVQPFAPASASAAQAAPALVRPASPSTVVLEYWIVDENNDLCLDGNLSRVILERCTTNDAHDLWFVHFNVGYAQEWGNGANSYCLDGTISAVSVQSCNSGDHHQWWDHELLPGSSVWGLMSDVNNDYCLDGNTSRVFPTVCNATDRHQVWKIHAPS